MGQEKDSRFDVFKVQQGRHMWRTAENIIYLDISSKSTLMFHHQQK